MKESNAPTDSVISMPSPTSTSSIYSNKRGSDFGKARYKLWVLAAILLLAFWSMFTGSVTLKLSTGNLTHLSHDLDFQIRDDDLDILEVEEKEKLVKHMWNIYTHSTSTRLPRFWQQAFEAAYQSLASDVSIVRDAAVSEIAKMSLRFFNPDPLPVQSTQKSGQKKSPTIKEKSNKPS